MTHYKEFRVPKGKQDFRSHAVVSPFEKKLILIVQHGACFYCLEPFASHRSDYNCGYTGYVMDHFIPRGKRGKNHPVNRVAACSLCDLRKSNHFPTDEQISRKRKHNRIIGWDTCVVPAKPEAVGAEQQPLITSDYQKRWQWWTFHPAARTET